MKGIVTSVSFVLIAWFGVADEIITSDGHVLEGKILRTGDPVEFRMIDGMVVVIPADCIKESISKHCILDEFEKKRGDLADNDVEGLVKLAAWCNENRLLGARIELLQKAIKIEPNHEEARKGLGHIQFDDSWRTEAELEDMTTKPLSEEDRRKSEARLPTWVKEANSGSNLYVSSVPAGLCVHVAEENDLGTNKFAVGEMKYLKGRTPLAVTVSAGTYYVSVERVTPDKQEYDGDPPQYGFYSRKCNANFLFGLVYKIEKKPGEGTYVISLIRPKGSTSMASIEQYLPPDGVFPIRREAWENMAKSINVPQEEREKYFDIFCKCGKIVHSADGKIYCLSVSGNNNFTSFVFQPR